MSYISANRRLTDDEMKQNAEYIRAYLEPQGWSLNAIAGMLGNMQSESRMNPGAWQRYVEPYSNLNTGFGLVQWTPASKYIDWCNANGLTPENMETALERINWELANGVQYYQKPAYPLSFAEFKVSTESAYYLGGAFLINYERPADQSEANQDKRGQQAEYWYNYLSGAEPVPPTPPDPVLRRRKMPIWMMCRRVS